MRETENGGGAHCTAAAEFCRRYETGEREADHATLIKFADYFHVSVDYLLEHTDEPKPYPKKTT